MRGLLLLVIGSSLLLAQGIPSVGAPFAFVSGGYSHEYTVTYGNSGQIPASQTNFPTLICFNQTLGNGNSCPMQTGLRGTGSGGYATNANCYDNIFAGSPTFYKTSPLIGRDSPYWFGVIKGNK